MPARLTAWLDSSPERLPLDRYRGFSLSRISYSQRRFNSLVTLQPPINDYPDPPASTIATPLKPIPRTSLPFIGFNNLRLCMLTVMSFHVIVGHRQDAGGMFMKSSFLVDRRFLLDRTHHARGFCWRLTKVSLPSKTPDVVISSYHQFHRLGIPRPLPLSALCAAPGGKPLAGA